MSDIPDPEMDFEGFCEASIAPLLAELEKIPEAQRAAYFIQSAAARLWNLTKIDAPAYFLEHERQLLLRRVRELPVYCADYDASILDDSSDNGTSPHE